MTKNTRIHGMTGRCRCFVLLFLLFPAAAWAQGAGAPAQEDPAQEDSAQEDPADTPTEDTNLTVPEDPAESATSEVPAPAPAPPVPPARDEGVEGAEGAEGAEGMTISWGGFIKADAIYNTSGRLGLVGGQDVADYFLVPGLVAVYDANDDDGGLLLNARESRIWFKTESQTSFGPLETYLELDLYGFSSGLGDEVLTNSSSMRFRHAYGRVGKLLAGQTWSTFMDLQALPEVNDFGSPAGRVFVRQAMVRWSQPLESMGATLDIAVENPETIVADRSDPVDPTGARIVADDNRAPDVVLRLSLDRKTTHFSVAGLVREVRVDDKTVLGLNGAAVAFALRASGVISMPGKDVFRFEASGGRGMGRYMALAAYEDGILDDAGDIDLIDTFGFHASYQHWWTDSVRSNLVLSHSRVFYGDTVVPTMTERLYTAHANIMWDVTARARAGLEYIYARRDLENGDHGMLTRVQASMKFTF